MAARWELLATEAVAAVVGLVVLALLNPRSLMRREAAMRRFLESLLGPPDAGSGGVTIWRDQHWAAG